MFLLFPFWRIFLQIQTIFSRHNIEILELTESVLLKNDLQGPLPFRRLEVFIHVCNHFQFVGEEERLPWQGWPSEGQPQLVHCLPLPALPPALLVLFCSTALLVLCKSSAIFTSALLYSARTYSCIGIQYKYTWCLSILVHHHTSMKACKKYVKCA